MTTTAPLNKSLLFQDLGYTPHPGQRPVHNSQAPRRILACGVRWGKTRCAAMEGLAAALSPCDRSFGWVAAPTYDLADKVFREIVKVCYEKLKHRIVKLSESDRLVRLINLAGGTSEIRGKSCDNPVSLLGEGLDWLIIDEAARVKPAIWEGHLSQRLIDKKGWALLISTPRGKGWFYDAWRRGRPNQDSAYQSWNSPSRENPHLDPQVIEDERKRIPDRSFLQEYEAQFLEGAGQVFRNVRECATLEAWPDVETKDKLFFGGLDLAKVEDYTVIVILDEEGQMVFTDRFHRIDWALQVERIKAISEQFGRNVLISVDSTGPGEPVFEQLVMADLAVRGYPFTARSKADLINNLALLIENGKIVLPTPELWPVGIDELESFEFSVTDAGNVRTSAPPGQHDDCVIALGLAAHQFGQILNGPRFVLPRR